MDGGGLGCISEVGGRKQQQQKHNVRRLSGGVVKLLAFRENQLKHELHCALIAESVFSRFHEDTPMHSW